MLKNLNISNYALIRSLDLEFGPGLTIITGETGAGKSIMLGALGLVMGGRADTKMISDGGKKSVVTAYFSDIDPELQPFFEERGIDWILDDAGIPELTIRRELTSSGRSRVLVNDTSVTLQTLSMIVPRLIDIHSQHANAKINNPSERLRIIDAMAGNGELREEYAMLFNDYVEIRKRIRQRREELESASKDSEFLRFQLEQLDKLAPRAGELAEIERRFEVLSDADEIKEKLTLLAALLGDGTTGAQGSFSEAVGIADKLDFKALSHDAEEGDEDSLTARIRNLLVETKDIFETVEDLNGRIDTDPAALSKLSERMNLYYEAMKRFRVKEADELVDLRDEYRRRLDGIAFADEELPELEKEARRLGHELKLKADSLSESRRVSAKLFSDRICETARPLGLPNIEFRADIRERKLCASGQDEVDFLCSFNKNGVLKPVGDIASGGEIARLMLSLKSILAGHINLPTIIFDEVDTGVSGEIADKMGEMMHITSQNMQVVAITHLPQVAAKGDEHFKVYKTDEEDRTETHVVPLTVEQRICELAAMISGSEVSEAALSAARTLLGSKAAGK